MKVTREMVDRMDEAFAAAHTYSVTTFFRLIYGAQHTRVSLGKASHRCHGDRRCTERCILVGPWRLPLKRWFKDEKGTWRQ